MLIVKVANEVENNNLLLCSCSFFGTLNYLFTTAVPLREAFSFIYISEINQWKVEQYVNFEIFAYSLYYN